MITGQQDTRQPQGMRWSTERRKRLVPYAADGVNYELVEEDYEVTVPVPPRDLDQIVLRGVVGVTVLLVTVAVIWSTVSIGSLLTITTAAAIAYGAAITFDATWIGCMGAEYLVRHDPKRSRLPRWGGHIALFISMAAVAVHGIVIVGGAAGIAAGIVGALISGLAKAMWTIVIRTTTRPLSPKAQKWLASRLDRMHVQLAVGFAERQVIRMQGQLLATRHALGLPAGEQEAAETSRPDGTPAWGGVTVESAIQAAVATMPQATPEEIVQQLALTGMAVDRDTVLAVVGNGQHKVPTPPATNVRPLRSNRTGKPSVRETILLALLDGVSPNDLTELRDRVTKAHGTVAPENFKKSRLRAIQDLRNLKAQQAGTAAG